MTDDTSKLTPSEKVVQEGRKPRKPRDVTIRGLILKGADNVFLGYDTDPGWDGIVLSNVSTARALADWLTRWADWKEAQDA